MITAGYTSRGEASLAMPTKSKSPPPPQNKMRSVRNLGMQAWMEAHLPGNIHAAMSSTEFCSNPPWLKAAGAPCGGARLRARGADIRQSTVGGTCRQLIYRRWSAVAIASCRSAIWICCRQGPEAHAGHHCTVNSAFWTPP